MISLGQHFVSHVPRSRSINIPRLVQKHQQYIIAPPPAKTQLWSKGLGASIMDSYGKTYVDFENKLASVSVGHGNTRVKVSLQEQLLHHTHCHNDSYQSPMVNLAELLLNTLSPTEWMVHLVSSRSQALSVASDIATVCTGNKVIGCSTGIATRYPNVNFSVISPDGFNNTMELERSLLFRDTYPLAGIVVEPPVRPSGESVCFEVTAETSAKLVKDYGGLLIVDETLSGLGRSGKSFWGFQSLPNYPTPDIIVLGNSLSNGLLDLGAVICRRPLAEKYLNSSELSTQIYHSVAFSVARGVLEACHSDNLITNSKLRGEQLHTGLDRICQQHPTLFQETRGTGLLQSLVGTEEMESIQQQLLEHGILVGIDPQQPNILTFQPPLCITETEVQLGLTTLEKVIT